MIVYYCRTGTSEQTVNYYCNHSILHTTAHAHNNYVCAPLRDVHFDYEYDFGDFKRRGGVLCLAIYRIVSYEERIVMASVSKSKKELANRLEVS